DGTFDPSWGDDGIASTGIGTFSNCLRPLVASDGRTYCAGASNGGQDAASDVDFAIHAYEANGALRTDFDGDGIFVVDPPEQSFSEGLVMVEASNGDLIVAGNQFILPSFTPINLIGFRVSPAGVAVGGYSISSPSTSIQAGFLAANDELVLAGVAGGSWWIGRYQGNSSPDSGFGTGGIITGPAGTVHGIIPLGQDFMAVGISGGTVATAFYNQNGVLISSYGEDGLALTNLSFSSRALNGAVRDREGRILLVGRDQGQPAVVRLTVDGFPDTSFGVGGKVTVDTGLPIDNQRSGGFGIAIDPIGRIVITGAVGAGGSEQVVVARLWP
ncbi:MAG: hypothetical protein KJO07_22485, partial [Deltaproteobacteria bacterium]|nr:hypothetical protein [Deltaproteobacteria bacterium]